MVGDPTTLKSTLGACMIMRSDQASTKTLVALMDPGNQDLCFIISRLLILRALSWGKKKTDLQYSTNMLQK